MFSNFCTCWEYSLTVMLFNNLEYICQILSKYYFYLFCRNALCRCKIVHVEIGYTQQSRTHNMILVVMMMSGIAYYFHSVHRYNNYIKMACIIYLTVKGNFAHIYIFGGFFRYTDNHINIFAVYIQYIRMLQCLNCA